MYDVAAHSTTVSTAQVQRSNNHVFLADFGLSQGITSSRVLGTKTMQSGTPGFQAPEQLKAEVIDAGADVYAFGSLLIELFGEKAVWEGLNPYQIIVKVVIEGEVPDHSHLHPSIRSICHECLKPKEHRSRMTTVLKALFQC